MKWKAQLLLSAAGQHTLGQYTQVPQHLEDLSTITIRNYLSDLRQFIAWYERSWHNILEDRTFTLQAVTPSLLIRYREYFQTTLGLKPSTVNRTLMSLKRSFSWARKTQFIQSNPTSPITIVPKESSPPRHLSDKEEDVLIAAVNATRTLRDEAITPLLLYTGIRVQELCTLTRQQVHLDKRNGTLRMTGKRKKVRKVPLNTTIRSILNQYRKTLPQELQYLFPSEKTQKALIRWTLEHVITKYAAQAQVADASPHDLRHHFGYLMAEMVPPNGIALIMGHDSLDTTMLSIRGTKQYLRKDMEKIAWI